MGRSSLDPNLLDLLQSTGAEERIAQNIHDISMTIHESYIKLSQSSIVHQDHQDILQMKNSSL